MKTMSSKKPMNKNTLADKAQEIIDGIIKSADEFNEFGLRLDGEQGSRYVLDPHNSLNDSIEYMLAADRQDTQNIEILLKNYPQKDVLKILEKFDLEGVEITD